MCEPIPYLHTKAMKRLVGALTSRRINTFDLGVGAVLASEVNGETMKTTINVDKIAERIGVSDRTVQACLRRLEGIGFIESTPRPGRSTVFKIIANPRTTFTPEGDSPPNEVRPTPEGGSGAPEGGSPLSVVSFIDLSETTFADREKADSTPGTLFDTDPAQAPAKAPRKAKAPTEKERTEAATRVLATYGEKVQPPSIDGGRSRAKGHLVRLLKTHTEADLAASVTNYATFCAAAKKGLDYRRSSGNFFGEAKDFEGFLPGAYEPPGPMDTWTPEEIIEERQAFEVSLQAGIDQGIDLTPGIEEYRKLFKCDPPRGILDAQGGEPK